MNRERIWTLARAYWFDALIVAAVGFGIATVVVGQDNSDGPQGPLWFDVLAVLGITVPLFFRRRWPFGAVALAAWRSPQARSSTAGSRRPAWCWSSRRSPASSSSACSISARHGLSDRFGEPASIKTEYADFGS